jgi:integrase
MVFRQPKTEKGRRLIALTPSTVSVLKEYKGNQIAQKIVAGTTLKEDDLVFCQDDGRPLLPGTVSHARIHLIQRTGLKNIRLHYARHSHASLMLKQGVHPKIVQERLGHASIQITLDTYSHVAPGLQQAAANRFGELINSKADSILTN